MNWLDKDGKIINPAIEVFACQKQTSTYNMDVRAPENAVQATVYATGHGQEPIVFSRISFKH